MSILSEFSVKKQSQNICIQIMMKTTMIMMITNRIRKLRDLSSSVQMSYAHQVSRKSVKSCRKWVPPQPFWHRLQNQPTSHIPILCYLGSQGLQSWCPLKLLPKGKTHLIDFRKIKGCNYSCTGQKCNSQ